MKGYWHKTGHFFPFLFPEVLWKRKSGQKTIYLTFDDGPIPEVTDFVLDELKKYNAQATFFCVGDNIRKYPAIFDRLIAQGHGVGNHTFHHLKGWKTSKAAYLANIAQCQECIERHLSAPNAGIKPFFRPPYGLMMPSQFWEIKKHYQVVMWEVLSGDFDPKLSQETCLERSLRYSSDGSIVVFHDNIKTYQKLTYVLPRYLQHFSEMGYVFARL